MKKIIYFILSIFLIFVFWGNVFWENNENINKKEFFLNNIKENENKLDNYKKTNFIHESTSYFSSFKEENNTYYIDGIFFIYSWDNLRKISKDFDLIKNSFLWEVFDLEKIINDENLIQKLQINFDNTYWVLGYYKYKNIEIVSEIHELTWNELNLAIKKVYNDYLKKITVKLENNTSQAKNITLIDTLVNKVSKTKVNKIKNNLKTIDFSWNKYEDTLNYLEVKILIKSIN